MRALPVVIKPSQVVSLPAPGKAGWIILKPSAAHAARAAAGKCVPLAPGSAPAGKNGFVAVGYSLATPNGYLGKINIVGCKGLYVSPTTINQALGDGSLDFSASTFHQVAGASPIKTVTKSFNQPISKNLSCTGSASASVSGSFKIGVIPALHATFSLFKLTSASFTLTGTASANLTVKANAGASCQLKSYPLISNYPIATFAGTAGPFPIVIVLRGQLSADLSASAAADTTISLDGSASITGGVAYGPPPSSCGGKTFGQFAAIFCGPNFTHTFISPKVTAAGSASVHVVPAVQALLYGAGGPQLTLTTGLDFTANASHNPWWTLTAPLSIDASLTALGHDSGTLRLYTKNPPFSILDAGGPFGHTPIVTVVNPGNQTSTVGTPVSLQIQATDTDGGPLAYAATGLPAGLTIDPSTGQVTGTPSSAGGSTVTVTATDATGPTTGASFTWTISPAGTRAGTITAVANGGPEICALLSTTGAACLGDNHLGQLGNGLATGPDCGGFCSYTAVAVHGITNATAITSGGLYACAGLSSGGVDCWGDNRFGELGNGTTTGPATCFGYPCSATPVAVIGITNATSVTAGESIAGDTACALLSTGGVDCWGDNGAGELGDGTTTGPDSCPFVFTNVGSSCSATPVAVSGITNATAVSAGGATCALLSTGGVDCWGDDSLGQIGNGTTPVLDCGGLCSSTPVAVSGISNATAISAGVYSTCAVLSTGKVACWGENDFGELGNGTTGGPDCNTKCSLTPLAVSGITNATAVATGLYHACALLSTGGVDCWGDNLAGELGNGTTTGPDCNAGYCNATPGPVSGITNAIAISAGDEETCALLSTGVVDCWGYNSSGQMGTLNYSSVPLPVTGFP